VTNATQKPLNKEAQSIQGLGSPASTETPAPADVSPSLLGYISPNFKTDAATQGEDPLNPTKSLGLTFSDAPSVSADDLIQELTKIVQDLLRQSNTTVDARRYSILPQGEGLSIADDPSSMSEDRLNELKQGQGSLQGGLSSEDGADMLKEEAQRNTPEVRRQKAMQMRYYLGL
jgi:hypothetical protein